MPSARKALRAADPDVAMRDVQTMDEIVSGSWARNRFEAALFGGFGIAALLLAASGIFAVLAYAVTFAQRRRLLDKLGNGPMIQRMVASTSVARKVVRAVEVVAALTLIALALARPQVGGRAKLTKQPGLDLVVAPYEFEAITR